MNTMTRDEAALMPHTVTGRTYKPRPFIDWERDANGLPITSDVIKEFAITFPTASDAIDYLVTYKGIDPERALMVVGRGCDFPIEPTAADGTFRLYKITR